VISTVLRAGTRNRLLGTGTCGCIVIVRQKWLEYADDFARGSTVRVVGAARERGALNGETPSAPQSVVGCMYVGQLGQIGAAAAKISYQRIGNCSSHHQGQSELAATARCQHPNSSNAGGGSAGQSERAPLLWRLVLRDPAASMRARYSETDAIQAAFGVEGSLRMTLQACGVANAAGGRLFVLQTRRLAPGAAGEHTSCGCGCGEAARRKGG